MEIRVCRVTSAAWEKIDDSPPHDQDIAKRILWQPEGVESSLGQWWLNGYGAGLGRLEEDGEDTKCVLINDEV